MTSSLRRLAPGFLLATPRLGDPNFDHTVVLLAMHGEGGALGFVVNRAAKLSLGRLLVAAGHGDLGADATPVYTGGPVQPTSGWILLVDAALDDEDDAVIGVGARVRVTSARAAFDEVAGDVRDGRPVGTRDDPRRRIVLLGYSGWGPGQLESEVAAGAWLPAPLDERVLFDVPAEDRWREAYALSGVSPMGMMSRSKGDA